MAQGRAPILHILAGPNGAGKTTFYDNLLSRQVSAEFVNPDRLALHALGHNATTAEHAKLGQDLANARRDALIAASKSLVTESTFSHPSKLELIGQAKAAGFRVVVYHLNLESGDLAVARVEHRVLYGGHAVPSDRIRGRYERNQALIRQAILEADRGFVFDNSRKGFRPRQLMQFDMGVVVKVADDLPRWAAKLYAPEIGLAAR